MGKLFAVFNRRMLSRLQRSLVSALLCVVLSFMGINSALAEDSEFVPAYQNEIDLGVEDANKYITYRSGRKYYTSGKRNGIRVNENNEESTDETIGIVTFILAPATIIYMNLIGWWE